MRRLTVLFAAMVAAIVLASGMAMSQTSPPVSYTVKNLGTLCGDSCSFPSSLAFAINDFGVVVGQASPPGPTGGAHAFLYSGGPMQDLGTLPGDRSSGASDINDFGKVVGTSFTPSDVGRAFLYSGSVMQNLGTLPGDTVSMAGDINDSGQVVGLSQNSREGRRRAFLYSDGQMQDLNTLIPADSGWVLTSAVAINTSGLIAGEGQINGQTRPFLATPNTDTTPPQLNLPNRLSQTATSPNGATVSYTATATDDLDGDLPVDCSPASGSTFPLGTTTVNCSAEDAAGNVGTGSFEVSVVYDFGNGSGGGFSEPVSSSALNEMKAGAGVPLKFGLGADFGLDIFAAGYPTSRTSSCETGLPTDLVEETVTVSASGLRYDASAGHYIYVWRTDKAWSGTCRELVLKLKDGSEHTAKFVFK